MARCKNRLWQATWSGLVKANRTSRQRQGDVLAGGYKIRIDEQSFSAKKNNAEQRKFIGTPVPMNRTKRKEPFVISGYCPKLGNTRRNVTEKKITTATRLQAHGSLNPFTSVRKRTRQQPPHSRLNAKIIQHVDSGYKLFPTPP